VRVRCSFLLLFNCVLMLPAFAQVANWEPVSSNVAYPARKNAAMIAFKDRLWVYGGALANGEEHRAGVAWSSADGARWEPAETSSPVIARSGLHITEFRGKLWLSGGDNGSNDGGEQQDVWTSEDGESWQLVVENAPWPRRTEHQMVVYRDRLWIIGGLHTVPGTEIEGGIPHARYIEALDDIWSSADGLTWELVNDEPPWYTRFDHQCVAYADKLWLFGGEVNGQFLADIWSSEDGITWTQHTDSAPWGGRSGHQILQHDGALWLIGGTVHDGRNQDPDDTVWRSTDGLGWEKVDSTLPLKIQLHSAAVFRGAMWVGCGEIKEPANGFTVEFADLWHSADAASWTAMLPDVQVPEGYMFDFVPHEGKWFAFNGRSTRHAYYSASEPLAWSPPGQAPDWQVRHLPAITSFCGKLWMMGGIGPGRVPENSVWSSEHGMEWTQELEHGEAPWPGRMGATALEFQDRLWLLGGTGDIGIRSDVWNSPDGREWTKVSDKAPIGIDIFRIKYAVHDDAIWMIGGEGLWKTSDGENWTQVVAQAPWGDQSARVFASMHGMLWVVGNHLWLSRDGETWLSYTQEGIPTRMDALFPRDENYLWMMGGLSNYQQLTDAYRMDARAVAADASARLAGVDRSAPAPEFPARAWTPPDSAQLMTQEELALANSGESESHNGWISLLGTADSTRRWHGGSAVVWNGKLWAFTESGYFSHSYDGDIWFDHPVSTPFASERSRAWGMRPAVVEDRLWILQHDRADDNVFAAGWRVSNLWSSQDGDTWQSHADQLPAVDGVAELLAFQGALYLFTADAVWSTKDGTAWEQLSEEVPWAGRTGYALAEHQAALYLMGGVRIVNGVPEGAGLSDLWRSEDGRTWTQLVDTLPFAPRSDTAIVSYDNHLWLLGGRIGGVDTNEVWVSAEGLSWSRLPTPGWGARSLVSAVVFNDFLCLIGGTNTGSIVEDAVWLTADGRTWQEPAQALPWTPREDAFVVSFKGSWWLIGGKEPGSPYWQESMRDIWRSDDLKNWELVTPDAAPLEDYVLQAVATDTALWLMASDSRDATVETLWRSEDGVNWEEMRPEAPWTARESVRFAGFKDKLWVVGGYDPTKMLEQPKLHHDVYTTVDGTTWDQLPDLPLSESIGFFELYSFTHNGEFWLYLDGNPSRDLWHTKDGNGWTYAPLPDKFSDYFGKFILSQGGTLWLIAGTIHHGQSDVIFSEDLRRMWRMSESGSWEELPHAAAVDVSFDYRLGLHALATDDGIALLDTVKRKLFRWDEERAKLEPDEAPPLGRMY